MLNFYKKILAVGMLSFTSMAWAQSPDIPLFADDENIYKESDHFQSAPQKSEEKKEQKKQEKLTLAPSNSIPNIGHNAIPLDSLRITPSGLPDIRIDLTDEKKKEEKTITTQPPKKESLSVRLDKNALAKTSPVSKNVKSIPKRQDPRDFELDEFYLGMTPMEIGQVALDKGYKIKKSKKELPLFMTTRYEQECRLAGFYMPADIRTCIREKSLNDGTVFLKDMLITKGKNESIYFEFTSPATGNQAWRMTYLNKGDNSLNFTQVNTTKKINRRDGFINAVLNKFGNPDDPKNYIWGDKNDAFMQISVYGTAYDTQIVLTDMALSDEDYFEAKNWLEETPSHEKFDF